MPRERMIGRERIPARLSLFGRWAPSWRPGGRGKLGGIPITDVVSDSRRFVRGPCSAAFGARDDGTTTFPWPASSSCGPVCERPVDAGLPSIVVPSVREASSPPPYTEIRRRSADGGGRGRTARARPRPAQHPVLPGLPGTIVEEARVSGEDAGPDDPRADMPAPACGDGPRLRDGDLLHALPRLRCRVFPLLRTFEPRVSGFPRDMEHYRAGFCSLRYARPDSEGAANDDTGRAAGGAFPRISVNRPPPTFARVSSGPA